MLPRIITLLVLAGFATPGEAHRLDAQAFLLPGKKVRVESWFSSGEAAHGATVRVFGKGNQLITEGRLDEQGGWVFSYTDQLPERIVVYAGAGHLKELTFNAADFNATKSDLADSQPLTDRNSGTRIKDILTGVGFLLALAAFALAIRNSRKIRALEKRKGGDV
jgi:hypothetical protein